MSFGPRRGSHLPLPPKPGTASERHPYLFHDRRRIPPLRLFATKNSAISGLYGPVTVKLEAVVAGP